jgi:hypothetical protein
MSGPPRFQLTGKPAGTARSDRVPAQAAEQDGYLAVLLAHQSIGIHDQHTVLHILDNELVDAQLVCKVFAPLPRDALVHDQTLRQTIGDQSGGEVSDRKQSRLHEGRGAGIEYEHPVCLLEKHCVRPAT